MKRRILTTLITLAAALCAAAPAPAATVPLPPGGWKVDLNPTEVRTTLAGTAGASAFAFADVEHNRIVTSGKLDRTALAHEVGHIFDWKVLTDADRAQLRRLLHLPAGGWWDWTPDGDAGEWFADYYAAMADGCNPRPRVARLRPGGPWGKQSGNCQPGYSTKIGPVRLERFRAYMAALVARDGLQTGVIR